jgi:excisionase family DNA binding protein
MAGNTSDWISLGEAAKLLGVHPTTLRTWADQGDFPSRRTPGRHRRFHRPSLLEWASQQNLAEKAASTPPQMANPSQHTPHAQVLVEYALGHTRYGVEGGHLQQQAWYGQMSAEGIKTSRQMGRKILEALVHHLEDKYPEGEELAAARRIGREYAQMLRGEGLSLAQAVQGYTYFDDFLVESVVQMMAPNMSSAPSEWSDLLRQINAFTNEILLALIQDYAT